MCDTYVCNIFQLNGHTALHMAAANGHLEIAIILINSCCDVNATNKVSYM